MNVQVRAKRILSGLASYRAIENVGDEFQSLREQALLRGLIPIGVYVNSQSEGRETLLISDLGLIVESEAGHSFVEYKNIERVDVVAGSALLEAGGTDKNEADGLLLSTLNASPQVIPVRNGNGKYRDVFEFARFMNRAIGDVRGAQLQGT